ncbi:aromatic ring-hydroxylating oxygenase subunit alpha, partial [Bordetella petrii]|uniref:aromatic ring-hydroxylating oxygenase subunit alpha n=1 Tax=Bordetella petrii TaxID=94624 RepID=UPI001E32EC74
MTDIATARHVAPARTQLPVSAYFDQARFDQEQDRIFKQSSLYVGHEKLVPAVGDWRTLAQEQNGRALVRGQHGVELISNVCRHRQALILGGQAGDVAGHARGSGSLKENGGNIVCPLHRWTYNNRGELLGAPQFE